MQNHADETLAGSQGSASRAGRQPTASFPAVIATIRLQGRSDCNPGAGAGAGTGRGSPSGAIVGIRDVEVEQDLQHLKEKPMVGGIVPLNRLVLPLHINSDADIRNAATAIGANMV